MATRQSQVIITANGKAAEIALQAIDQKVKQLEQDEKRLKQTLDALRRANKADTDEFKAKQETLRQTANELKNLRGALDQGRSGMEQVDKAVKNLANSTTRQLRDALRAGKKELEHMAATNKDLGPLKQKLQQNRLNLNLQRKIILQWRRKQRL